MKRFLQYLNLAVWLGLAPLAAQAKLKLIATTADFGSIAEVVGGDKVEVTSLARATEDPHFVDAKPSFIVKMNRADVLLEGGAELEIGWLPPLLDGSRNTKLAAGAPAHIMGSQGVRLLEVPSTLDRSKGDIHAAGNPHFMTDPANARIVAVHVAEVLSELDPKSAEAYRANLKKFTDALDARMTEWEHLLAPYKGQEVVAYHNSWPYFAERYGLKMDLFLEPKPGIPPTPAHLAEVITRMKASGAHVIIVDPYLNRKTAETVARNTGAAVVDVTQFPGGIKGTEGGYIAMMDHVVNALAKALATKP